MQHTQPKSQEDSGYRMDGRGLIVDLFAGGGGASTGLAMALGRDPDIAINHDAEALAMHKTNHPNTRHLLNDITRVLPLEATGGQPVAILHASPDCTHFSKAKGAKPKSQFIRDLAWTVVRWAEDAHPMLITLENVEEFQTWGPLDRAGHPIKSQAGTTFRAWVRRLRRLGYKVDWRLLRACDYGAPTTRRRLFVVARRDGKPIAWPKPTHGSPKSAEVGAGKLLPWRTAAECIDWSLPTQSIFDRKKPLAVNTQRRIAQGLRRYVLHTPEPFVVTYYGSKSATDFRGLDLGRPLPTQTFALATTHAVPFVQHVQHSKAAGGVMPADEPLRTITAQPKGGGMAIVAPILSRQFGQSIGQRMDLPHPTITQCNHDALIQAACVAKHYGGVIGHGLMQPLGTVTTIDHHSLVTASMVKMRGTNIGAPANEPLHTVSAQGQHHALMTAHITKFYGKSDCSDLDEPMHTLLSKEHMALSSACMVRYYGTALAAPLSDPLHTITARARMGLVDADLGGDSPRYDQVRAWLRQWGVIGPDDEAEVTYQGLVYRINDICMRMLAPRELYTTQGFGAGYEIEQMREGTRLTKTAQVRMCGNSVPPQLVCALVSANGPQTWAQVPLPAMPLMEAYAAGWR